MRKTGSRIGVEIVFLGLVLASLAGALALVASAYRRPSPAKTPPVMAVAPEQVEAPEPEPPPLVAVDLTPGKLAEIAAREAEDKAAAAKADRVAGERENAVAAAIAQAARWKERENLVRRKIDALEVQARRVEDQLDELAVERDILAQRRDEAKAKAAKAKAHARDGVAVLPYKGPNGTWRRPIAIDCASGSVTLQPGGPRFTNAQLSGYATLRLHPLVQAVAKVMVRARTVDTPDGAPSVPYILFIIRPDGIQSYYMARALLDPLGIVQGYELADADWDIEFPDLNDPDEWKDLPSQTPSTAWPPPPTDNPIAGRRPSRSMTKAELDGQGEAPGWGQARGIGNEVRPSPGGGLGADSFEAMARGEAAGRPLPQDGRVPIIPGRDDDDDLPRFEPTPPSSANPPGRNGRNAPAGSGNAWENPPLPPANPPRMGSGFPNAPVRPSLPVPGGSPPQAPTNSLGSLIDGGSGSGTSETTSMRAGAANRPAGTAGAPLDPAVTAGAGGANPPSGAIANNAGTSAKGDPLAGLGDAPNSSSGDILDSITASELSTGLTSAGSPGGTSGQSAGSTSPSPSNSPSQGMSGSNRANPGGATGSSTGQVSLGALGQPSSSSSSSTNSSARSGGSGSGQDRDAKKGQATPDDSYQSRSIDMTVVCGPNGVTIGQTGETLDWAALTRNDQALPTKLAAIVEQRRAAQPGVGLRPHVKFLLQPGGEKVYLRAKWQTTYAGTGWPMTLQMAGASPNRAFGKEVR